ncbi:MAG: ATP-binding protein [Planctomycetota bacterium]
MEDRPSIGPTAAQVAARILEVMPVAIWTMDSGGRILFQNPAARDVLGLELGASLSEAAPNAWAWNTLRPIQAKHWAWNRVLEAGARPIDQVVAIELPGGRLRSLILSALPVALPGAGDTRAVVVAIDCSTLLATHEQLHQTSSLLRSTLESVTNGILVIDREGRIVIHNRVFAELWHMPADVLESGEDNRALEVALGQLEEPGRFLATVRELYAKPLERSFDELRLKDGRVFERYSIPQLLEGVPVGRVWSFWDVTERKRAEAALEKALDSERRACSEAVAARERLGILASISAALASAFEDPRAIEVAARSTIPYLCDWAILDQVGEDGELRRVVVAHADPELETLARAVETLRQAPEMTKGPIAVVRTGRAELYEHITDEDIEAIEPTPEQLDVIRALAPRSAMIVPLIARGRTLGTITFVATTSGRNYTTTDLTFALQVAGRIALSLDNAFLYQGARDAVGARDEVLSIVSHDLRNPLAAIHAGVSLMLRRVGATDAGSVETQRRSLELVQKTARRMNRLIDDLLDAARADAKQLSLSCDPVDVERLVRDAVDAELPLAAPKKIAFKVTIQRGPPAVSGDRDRLHQVLANLLGNAIKFTPEGGKIEVSARVLDDAVCCSIADNGPGIPAADMKRIFDRFWQARRHAAMGLGVGLGLAIAKGIVEAHGGRIWATSEPGRGATLSFTIPTPAAPANRRAA